MCGLVSKVVAQFMCIGFEQVLALFDMALLVLEGDRGGVVEELLEVPSYRNAFTFESYRGTIYVIFSFVAVEVGVCRMFDVVDQTQAVSDNTDWGRWGA